VSVQLSIVPTSVLAWSTTRNVHVPLTLPVKDENEPSGIYVPVKGAAPDEIAGAPEGTKRVLVKLFPLPPLLLLSNIEFPEGEIRETSISPSYV
jgi:hypothetical protein